MLPFLGNGVTPLDLVGFALADTWFQLANLGWHLPRADCWAGYAFMAPTGRYTPGATNNVGSGYWGSHFTVRHLLLTKDQGTTANIIGIGRSTDQNHPVAGTSARCSGRCPSTSR